MNLLQKVKEEVDKLMPFIYNDLVRANNALDYSALPACVAFRNPTSRWFNNFGNYCEECDWLLFFVDKTEFDKTSLENEAIIETMKNAGIQFVRNVRRSSELHIIKQIGGSEYKVDKVYEKFDLNTTGVGLQITLRETKGVCNGRPK